MDLDIDRLWQIAKAHQVAMQHIADGGSVENSHIRILQLWVETFTADVVLSLVEKAQAWEESLESARDRRV